MKLKPGCSPHKDSGGYYLMTWGGGRYTSIMWDTNLSSLEKELARLLDAGLWSGKPPYIEGYKPHD